MGHLPVVEIISDESEERLLPVSAALREELFALHRQATFISSTGGVIEEALEGDWPTNPNLHHQQAQEDGLHALKRLIPCQVSHFPNYCTL